MSPDTLLLITSSYPERADGSEAAGSFVADMAQYLSRYVPVRVVAPGAGNTSLQMQGGIQVRRFASTGKPLSLLSPMRLSDWPVILATTRSLRAQTLAANADGRIVHTLALWTLPSGWAARILQRAHGVPYSVWALGSDIWSLGRIPGLRAILRQVIRGASNRYADGFQLAEDAARIGGLPFEFLPSTRLVEATRVRPVASSPPYRLLFLGRWHPNKGIDLLLDALAMLDNADWERIAEVRIAGGGPLEDLVRQRVVELQAAGRPVRMQGFLDAASAYAAIGDADWLLLPSRIESIPVVFSDAAKLGCPVIASPVGDLPRLFSRQSVGVLATSASVVAIARSIHDALMQDPCIYAPGLMATAAQFDISGIASRLCQDMLEKSLD